jgi:hypothetical protein
MQKLKSWLSQHFEDLIVVVASVYLTIISIYWLTR